MKQLVDFKKEIHKCSKCGLCQAECPIYKITGNDCSVSRGQFIMLKGFLKGELKLTKTISSKISYGVSQKIAKIAIWQSKEIKNTGCGILLYFFSQK